MTTEELHPCAAELATYVQEEPVSTLDHGLPQPLVELVDRALAQAEGRELAILVRDLARTALCIGRMGYITVRHQIHDAIQAHGARYRAVIEAASTPGVLGDNAQRALAMQPRPQPALEGESRPDGAVSFQAFRVALR